ncbi:glycerol-3-phosphate acyltransferase [Aestuariirhabdus sp. Z084]|uniref:glycerol-3-phosphate acyltransferase n=1 Tax=Aestuariirhabdus haliotis TaxID=2918751 RepID=UPI00201B3573|nr:glycerol-3-phosphate acyltransferase [Aestuariirhabdus haliotis]MCL6416046.1 glycerol-3-phosphate acyltransferase [Aestuariirhabdus haliotis]MCL6419386.1 glycerol-3-phosphate acyltransferase [Aestuariirhabdus haliotis]
MIILRLMGCLYLASGLWCAAQPELSATYLGLGTLNEQGLAEFFSVYGGLQIGLGAAMLLGSFYQTYQPGALLFSALFSTSLALCRLISLIQYNTFSTQLPFLLLESVIAMLLVYVLIRHNNNIQQS